MTFGHFARISYEVGTVEEHSPPLRVERSPCGGAFAGVLREEFLVQTKVLKGSREVHIHPHCLLKNMKARLVLGCPIFGGPKNLLPPQKKENPEIHHVLHEFTKRGNLLPAKKCPCGS